MSTGRVASHAPAAEGRPWQRIGRYDVFQAFARGGMASVHLGRLTGASGFTRVVAIKRLHPLYAESDEHCRMLREEARILSRIRHANVVSLLDVVHADGELCLVMDYIAGVALADLARDAIALGERLSPPVAVAIVVDMLRGLHAAHEARGEDGAPLEVVHRDVSPHNVLVGADGVARVLDFGIAKALRTEQLTLSGDLRGKLTYMAPEQLRGARATRQSDVFSAGVTLWEVLAARKLFGEEGGVAPSSLSLSLSRPVPPPSQWASDVPPHLDAALGRALALDPRERFESAEEMALALEDACSPAGREVVRAHVERIAADELERRAERVQEVELAPGDGPEPAETAEPAVPLGLVARAPRRSPRVAVALTLAGLVGAAAFIALRPTSPAAPREAAPSAPVSVASTPSAPASSAIDPALASLSADAAADVAAVAIPDAATRAGGALRPAVKKVPDCTPAFRIDGAGVKIYKPECL